MELSALCGLKVSLAIFDESRNRLQEYASHSDFLVEHVATQKVEAPKLRKKSMAYKLITNEDMRKFFSKDEEMPVPVAAAPAGADDDD